MNRNSRYLGTFNLPSAGEPATPVGAPPPAPAGAAPNPPPAPPPAPPAGGDAAALAAAHAARAHAQLLVEQARAQHAAANPPPPEEEPLQSRSATAEELRRLRMTVEAQATALRQQALQTYRQNTIAAYQSQGVGLVEGMVSGVSEQEILASAAAAAAEYNVIQQRVLAQYHNDLRAAAGAALPITVVPPAAPPLVGNVTNVMAAAPQVPAAISAPQVIAAPPVVAAQPGGGVDPAYLAYLTSPEAIRNGDYQRNRALIMAHLRSMGGQAPGPFTLTHGGARLAPPTPAPQAQAPAMSFQPAPNGVMQPYVPAPTQSVPIPSVSPALPASAAQAFQLGAAQQPGDLQTQGGAPTGVPVNFAAAQAAARASILTARTRNNQ